MQHICGGWNILGIIESDHGKSGKAAGPVHSEICGGGKLALLTHIFVFVLYVFCGKIFAHLSGWPSMRLPFFLLRGAVGALAVIAAQLVLAMMIRSFAVPIFLGLVGGVTGMFAGSKGFALAWPYCLMQAGMNANKKRMC